MHLTAEGIIDEVQAWRQIGEGGANLVFAYAGENPELVGKVIRVKKGVSQQASGPPASLEERLWSVYPKLSSAGSVHKGVLYVQDVMSAFIDSHFISPQIPVRLSPALHAHLAPSSQARPPGADFFATLQPNHSLLPADYALGRMPTLCVELKPKFGSLPVSAAIAPLHRALKGTTSRYTLHQRHKLQQGKIVRMSKYDPLDLFSRDTERMRQALLALLAEPQNNLRLFSNGRPIDFSGVSSSQGDVQLAAAVDGVLPISTRDPGATLADALLEVLLDTGVLQGILRAQQLDVHDVEGAHVIYQTLLQRQGLTPSDCTLPETPHSSNASPPQSSSIPSLNEGQMQATCAQGVALRGHSSPSRRSVLGEVLGSEAEEEHKAALNKLRAMPDTEALAALRDYLIAATAKDCAIMITFQTGCLSKPEFGPTAPGPSTSRQESKGGKGGSAMHNAAVVANSNNNRSSSCGLLRSASDEPCIQYKVAVIDLDMKPLSKIPQHYDLDQAIMRCTLAAHRDN